MATKRQLELIEIVKQREKAVSRKIRRLENKGVRVGGSEYDPRRIGAPVNELSTRDLNSYVRKLNQFTDRKTQFVPGVSGKPLRAEKWKEYKRRETIANNVSMRYRKKIDDVYNPIKGMTMGEYRAMKRGDLPSRLIPSVNDAFDVRSRISRGFPNEQALDKAIAQEKKRATPANFRNWQKSNRLAAKKMLTALNEKEFAKTLDKLTDEQFHLFWESGASEVALNYVVAQSAFEGGEEQEPQWWQQRSGDEIAEVSMIAEWASTVKIEPDGKAKRKPRKRNYTNTNAGPIKIWTDTKAGPINLWTDTKARPIDLPES